MDESQFTQAAERTLDQLEAALDDCAADIDIERKPGGVLELEFPDGAKIIVNRHGAAREIWVAAKSGGFHFRAEGERWINTRDGEELWAALERLIAAHIAGVRLRA